MAVPQALAAPSTRVIDLFRMRCLSLGPQAGPPVSSTSISTSPTGTPSTTFGTLIFFFAMTRPQSIRGGHVLMPMYWCERITGVSTCPCQPGRSCLLRGRQCRLEDVRIGPAPAEVPLARLAHVLLGRLGILLQQRRDRRDEARRAEAAHHRVLLDERGLHRIR